MASQRDIAAFQQRDWQAYAMRDWNDLEECNRQHMLAQVQNTLNIWSSKK